METHKRLAQDDLEYERLARGEIEHYSNLFVGESARPSARETLLQPVPPTWIEVENRASAIVRQQTGADLNGHVLQRLRSRDGVRMLSLGSGPGGIELAFARQASNARIVCYDFNPDLVRLGQERANSEQLAIHFE